jgi:hypothetical protein
VPVVVDAERDHPVRDPASVVGVDGDDLADPQVLAVGRDAQGERPGGHRRCHRPGAQHDRSHAGDQGDQQRERAQHPGDGGQVDQQPGGTRHAGARRPGGPRLGTHAPAHPRREGQ